MEDFTLRADLTVDWVLRVLRELVSGAKNTTAYSGRIDAHRDSYLQWVEMAETQLRSLFVSSGVWQGLQTPRYWEVRGVTAHTPRAPALIQAEADWQAERLQAIADAVTREARAFSAPEGTSIVVPDTNVFIHYEFYD